MKELGFSELDSFQAFIACDRNEELAANFLFEHGDASSLGAFQGLAPAPNPNPLPQPIVPEIKAEEKAEVKKEQSKEEGYC